MSLSDGTSHVATVVRFQLAGQSQQFLRSIDHGNLSYFVLFFAFHNFAPDSFVQPPSRYAQEAIVLVCVRAFFLILFTRLINLCCEAND